MKIKLTSLQKAYTENGDIVLNLTIPRQYRYVLEQSLKEEELQVEFSKYRKNRSLDQNAYLWELLTKLSELYAGTKEKTAVYEIYCAILEEAQIDYDYIIAPERAEIKLRETFRAVRKIGERDIKNGDKVTKSNVYQVFIGSSKFDTKQMTDLIELVKNKLAELGYVETIEENRYF